MRRLAALAVIAALVTFVPMVAWASLASGSCCAAKNAPPPAPMSCCTTTKCSMSESAPEPILPSEAESTPAAPKTAAPAPALPAVVPAIAATDAAHLACEDQSALPAVSVDRKLSLLSLYLI
ncbi:MAG: hypothetical protein NDJ92_02130 [Thermoanaerobaculia bacterium]|nr:hypothetical protein [Thermoanaerobaculia bacterium]